MLVTDDLDSLKRDPQILKVYGQFLKLKKSGPNYTCQCPFHTDKTPSFCIHPDGMWTCFSGCGTGNIFQFLEKIGAVQDFKEAVERVKQELGKTDSWGEAKAQVEQVFRPVAEPKTYKTLPLSGWVKQESALENSTAARRWLLEERGITFETAKRLRLGFVPTIGNLAGQDGADIAAGGWIAFPSIEGDQIVSCKFRSIIRKKPGGFARMLGFATTLWNQETIDCFSVVYVTEGEFDACVLEQAGFRAVSVPSAGVKLSAAHKDQLMQASMVILAGDSDPTGAGYMRKLWAELQERCYLLQWPEGVKDANEYFLKTCGGDVEKFREQVEQLTSKAKTNPLPDIHSIQEVMKNGEDTNLSDRADRLRFPWPSVDKMAILLPGSVLGVMATSTGQGKTAWTLQASLFGARKHNEVVVNWQCELTPSEIAVMVAAQVLRKNRNFLTKEDLKTASEMLGGCEYYIGNSPNDLGIMEVLDIIEAAIRRLGATTFVLDNLHYYTTGIDDEVRMQAATMRRIKQICVTYGCKGIVVSQPRKATTQNKGKKTHISDAKGSASLGDTCDSFAAIHRELAKRDEGQELNDIYEDRTLVEMLKTRSKGVGKSSAFLTFFGEFAEFCEIETFHEDVVQYE